MMVTCSFSSDAFDELALQALYLRGDVVQLRTVLGMQPVFGQSSVDDAGLVERDFDGEREWWW
jgi:hypothetical protein